MSSRNYCHFPPCKALRRGDEENKDFIAAWNSNAKPFLKCSRSMNAKASIPALRKHAAEPPLGAEDHRGAGVAGLWEWDGQ